MSTYDYYKKNQDPTPRMRKMSGPFTDEELTVADAVEFCRKNGLDINKVRLPECFVVWDEVESDEEVQARIKRSKKQQEEHLERIREIFEEYNARGLYDNT